MVAKRATTARLSCRSFERHNGHHKIYCNDLTAFTDDHNKKINHTEGCTLTKGDTLVQTANTHENYNPVKIIQKPLLVEQFRRQHLNYLSVMIRRQCKKIWRQRAYTL